MNKQIQLGKLSKASLSSIKLPKGITITQIALILIIVVLLALAIFFAVSYFSSSGKRADLESDIKLKTALIDGMGGLQNIGALTSQLEQAQQDLIDENPFPLEINNIDMAGQIIEAAADANIACIQYSASDPGAVSINGNTYAKNSFMLSSSGADGGGEKITRIIKFLKNIEDLPYNAVSISGLSLSAGADQTLWIFGFTLSILSQQ